MQNPMLDSSNISGLKQDQHQVYTKSIYENKQKYPVLINSNIQNKSVQKQDFQNMYPSIYQQQKAPSIKKVDTQFSQTNSNQQNFNMAQSNKSQYNNNYYYSNQFANSNHTNQTRDQDINHQDEDENDPKNIIITKRQQSKTEESELYTFSTKSIDELKVQKFKTDFYIFKRLLSLWYVNPKHLADYGIGYSMYFFILFDCLLMLIMIFLTSGIFNLLTNGNGTFCNTLDEAKEMIQKGTKSYQICLISPQTQYSFANRISSPNEMMSQDIFVMITTVILAIYLFYIHRKLRIINNEIDYQFISPSDFVIWIQYNDNTDLTEIKRHIQHCGSNEEFQGHQFLLVDDIIQVKHIELTQFEEAIVKKAPEPLDINWNNLEISRPTQIFYKFVSYSLTIVFISFCLLVNILLIGFQSRLTESVKIEDDNGNLVAIEVNTKDAKFIGYIVSFFIFLTNSIFSYILEKLASLESHYDKTREQSSFAIKLALSRFINIAIIPFIVLVLSDILQSPQDLASDTYESNGLIDNQINNFKITAILNILVLIIDPVRIFKIIGACLSCSFDEWKEPENNLSQMFSELVKTMLFTAFYAPLIPISILIAFIGLLILYPIQLYKIIYHRRKTYKISSVMPLAMLDMVKYIVPIYAITNTMFQYQLNEQYHITLYSLISISIGIIVILMPESFLNSCLGINDIKQEFDGELFHQSAKHNYKQAFAKYRRYYASSYRIQNPLFQYNEQDQYYNEEQVKLYMEGRLYDGYSCL